MSRNIASETLLGMIGGAPPGALDEAARALREDPGRAGEFVSALPELVNAESRLLAALYEALLSLPAEERSRLAREALSGVDGRALGAAAIAWGSIVMTVARENPKLMDELAPKLKEALGSTDFGKLREAVTALADYGGALGAELSAEVAGNPVITANLAGMVGPVVNNALKVLARTLDEAELPPEVLASSLFAILGDLDAETLGKIIGKASSAINDLHSGNLVLGRDEPYFRRVFSAILEDAVKGVEPAELADAAVALAEDAELMADVAIGKLSANQEALVQTVIAGAAIEIIVLRSVAMLTERFNQVSDEGLVEVGEFVRENLDISDLVRGVNNWLALYNRFSRLNPGLYAKLAKDAAEQVDPEEAVDFVFGAAADLIGEKGPDPAAVGRGINRLAAGCNDFALRHPEAIKDFLPGVVAELDEKAIGQAADGAMAGLIEAVEKNPEKVRAIMAALARSGWKLLKAAVSSPWRRGGKGVRS